MFKTLFLFLVTYRPYLYLFNPWFLIVFEWKCKNRPKATKNKYILYIFANFQILFFPHSFAKEKNNLSRKYKKNISYIG